jgi:hypothetical protein
LQSLQAVLTTHPSAAPAAGPAAQPAGPWSDTPGDHYSEGDVRFHVRNIVKKIKDRNRVEAFRGGLESGNRRASPLGCARRVDVFQASVVCRARGLRAPRVTAQPASLNARLAQLPADQHSFCLTQRAHRKGSPGLDRHLCSILCFEFLHDAAHVNLDRAFTHVQFVPYDFVRLALLNRANHRELAGCHRA